MNCTVRMSFECLLTFRAQDMRSLMFHGAMYNTPNAINCHCNGCWHSGWADTITYLKGYNQICSCCTHRTRHRCSHSAAGWGVRRCPGSRGSSCSRPTQRCRPVPAPCGLWAGRTAAGLAAPRPSGSGNTGGNWGPKPSARPPPGLEKKYKHKVRRSTEITHSLIQHSIGNGLFFKCSWKIGRKWQDLILQGTFTLPVLFRFYYFILSHRSFFGHYYILPHLLPMCSEYDPFTLYLWP